MKKVLIVVLSLFWIPMAAFSQSQKDAVGTVTGYIYNVSKSSKAKKVGLSNQEIVLHRYVDGQADENPKAHVVSDAKGRFHFKNLEVGEQFAYYPATVVDGIEYYGNLVTVTNDTLERQSNILFFEPTASDSTISVAMQHVIVTPRAGVLQVKEIIIFENRSQYTYVGSTPTGTPGKKIVLQIDVPENAQEVGFGGDLMKCCAVVNGKQIFDTMAFKPGVRREVVSYILPYENEELSFVKKVAHPTRVLDIFTPANAGVLNAPAFKSQGNFPIRGENYTRYTVENAEKGTELSLQFTSLPKPPANVNWLPPVFFAIVVVVAVGFYLWRKKLTPAAGISDEKQAELSPEAQRNQLFDKILDLDDDYDSGKLDIQEYNSTRKKMIEELLQMDEKLTENSSETIQPEETDHESR